jgi:uncharacterized protein (DUF2336 family)
MGIKKARKTAGQVHVTAIARMKKTAPRSLLDELEAAIQSGSSKRRTEMLTRITDLFVDNAPRVNDAQVGVFDDVFEHLIREIESEAMLQLSERIAPVENAPERLIRRLAHDDAIEISGPVLARSDRIGEDELVEIARTKSQAHLAAIAGRAALGEQITDVLVERGDVTVARKVAANSGARISELSLRSLVDRAGDDGDLAHAVARRRELPPAMFRNLLARATDAVRKRLVDTANPATAKVINKIIAEISQKVESQTVSKRNYHDAKAAVIDLQKQNGISPAVLVQFAKAQRLEETVVVLSLLTGVAIDVIDRFLDDPSDDPILILCKAMDLDWNTTLPVLTVRHGVVQLRESRAEEANKKYRKLSTYSAQRVMRFWQAREKVAAAG